MLKYDKVAFFKALATWAQFRSPELFWKSFEFNYEMQVL